MPKKSDKSTKKEWWWKKYSLSIRSYVQSIPGWLLYQLITSVILWAGVKLFSWLSARLMMIGGHIAITSGDFAWILWSWQGWIIVFLAVVLGFAYVMTDVYTKIILCTHFLEHSKIKWKKLGRQAIAICKKFLNWRGALFTIYILLIGPMVGFELTVGATRNLYIPTFITNVITANVWLDIAYNLVRIAFFLLGYIHIFAFPALIIDDMDLKSALKQSRQLMKKYWWDFLVTQLIISWKAFWMGVSIIVVSLGLPFLGALLLNAECIDNYLLLYGTFLVVMVAVMTFLVTPFYMMCLVQKYMMYTRGKKVDYPIYKNRKAWWWVIGALMVVGVVATVMGIIPDSDRIDLEIFWGAQHIVGHRAGGKEVTENTLAALNYAIELGLDGAEFDVQRTKDGYYIINHDNTFKRVANVNKTPMEMTLSEIRHLRVKVNNNPEASGEPVPTYEEFLDAGKDKITLFTELKGKSADTDMADDLVTMVREREMLDQVVFISLNYNLIRYMEARYPDVQTGYILSAGYGNLDMLPCDWIAMEEEMAHNDHMIDVVHAQGKKVIVWSANEYNNQKHFLLSDVDAFMTDKMTQALELRQELAERPEPIVLLDELLEIIN